MKVFFTVLMLLVLAFTCQAQVVIPKDSMVNYKVKAKENLYRISIKFHCSVQQIKEWNKLSNVDYIQTGQILKIKLMPKAQPEESEEAKFQNFVQNKIKYLESLIRDSSNSNSFLNTINYDSLIRRIGLYVNKSDYNKNLALDGTRLTQRDENYDSTGQLKISGYLSTYYAYFNDSVGAGNFEAFPTSAPLHNNFSLNLLQINAKYNSNRFRGNFTLQYGDIPISAWSSKLNFIQEANAGFKVLKGLWFDIGFFRTHLGLESIQPRENITSSIAIPTYFEPYFLSGAKLTYSPVSKLSFQVGVFNGFNTFIETNSNKTLCFSVLYDVSSKLSLTYNVLYTDESPSAQTIKQPRLYQDFFLTLKTKYLDMGAEFNYGLQKNTLKSDLTKQAEMMSALLIAKIKWTKRFAIYGRGEYYADANEMLTGTVLNGNNESVGLNLWGATGGVEFKPIANSYLRFEFRQIETLKENQQIFYRNQKYHRNREEIIGALGFWF